MAEITVGGARAPFALTPIQPNPAEPIKYTNTIIIKLFTYDTQYLPEIFDSESDYNAMFNKKLLERATKSGWTEPGAYITMVPNSVPWLPPTVTSTNTLLVRVTGTVPGQDVVHYGVGG